jgi:hypothetical protein
MWPRVSRCKRADRRSAGSSPCSSVLAADLPGPTGARLAAPAPAGSLRLPVGGADTHPRAECHLGRRRSSVRAAPRGSHAPCGAVRAGPGAPGATRRLPEPVPAPEQWCGDESRAHPDPARPDRRAAEQEYRARGTWGTPDPRSWCDTGSSDAPRSSSVPVHASLQRPQLTRARNK